MTGRDTGAAANVRRMDEDEDEDKNGEENEKQNKGMDARRRAPLGVSPVAGIVCRVLLFARRRADLIDGKWMSASAGCLVQKQ